MTTGLSAVRCRLATRVTLRQLPSPSSFVELLLAFPCPLPVTSRSRAQAFVWFRAKTDKGIVCLADHLHSVTLSIKVPIRKKSGNLFNDPCRIHSKYWFVFVLWHINYCRLFNAKSFYTYIKYMITKHISYITCLNEPEIFSHSKIVLLISMLYE